jgi:hypothetical protein
LVSPQVDSLDYASQQLTCLAHKRHALEVFFFAWAFAHEHQLSLGVARTEHNLRASFRQSAPPAVPDLAS